MTWFSVLVIPLPPSLEVVIVYSTATIQVTLSKRVLITFFVFLAWRSLTIHTVFLVVLIGRA